MEIKIRDIDAGVVSKLDELAKKRRLSRNEYLKEQLTVLATIPAIRENEDKYSTLVKEICNFIAYQGEELKKIKNDIKKGYNK